MRSVSLGFFTLMRNLGQALGVQLGMNLSVIIPNIRAAAFCGFLMKSGGWIWIRRILPRTDPDLLPESRRAEGAVSAEGTQSAVPAPVRNERKN